MRDNPSKSMDEASREMEWRAGMDGEMGNTIDGGAKTLPPFLLKPEFVARVWGFSDLRPWFDCARPEEPIGEAWLTGDACLAASGPCEGERLDAIFAAHGQAMLGAAAGDDSSPLLLKVLFAREKLSVQVHPDDALARRLGMPRGKTECWYALAADPGAEVACGLKPGVSLETVRQQIIAGTLEESLELLPMSAGDMVLVEAGTIHAIHPGSILLEVQQNSDSTYRLYDYGRGRELQIERGLEALRTQTYAGKVAPRAGRQRTVLLETEYFRMERMDAAAGGFSAEQLRGEESPALSYLFAARGEARVSGEGFAPFTIPANYVAAVPAETAGFRVAWDRETELVRIVDCKGRASI